MTIRNDGLMKAYTAGAAISARRLVKFDSDDRTVIQGAAGADLLIGVSDLAATAAGERVDVIHTDIATVEYGGNVTRGQLLMSDSVGRAITATASAGVNVRYAGVAIVSGVSGDLGAILLAPGSLQG